MKKRLEEYFNYMAIIIRKILDCNCLYSEKDFESVLDDSDNPRYIKLIREFPQLVDDSKRPCDIKLYNLTLDFFANVKGVIDEEDIYLLEILLYHMDCAIKACYQSNYCFEEDVESYVAFNPNYKETDIVIMRNTNCKWSCKMLGDNLNGLLKNFYYIDQKKLPDIEVVHHIMDENVMQLNKGVFKMALSPITNKKLVYFSDPYESTNEHTGAKQYYFRVKKVENEEGLTKQILDNIYEAGSNGTDIIVFPEMMGTGNMLNTVMRHLAEKTNKAIPHLIVFPSIWEVSENDDNNTNASCMILDGDEIIFKQKKYCDFRFPWEKRYVYEDINRKLKDKKSMHLLHIEGLGRICIIICFDYLDSGNRMRLLEHLRPTLVCSPSFSTGSFPFRILAESAYYMGCNWIWCNTCSAAHETDKKDNFKIIGVMTTLNKSCDLNNIDRETVTCEGQANCGNTMCEKCIYYADIPLL